MKHISINVSEEIKNIFPLTLEKDLQDNEAICPVCHGLGIVQSNNVYGIKGDTSEAAQKSMFPYNHQSFTLCPNCYNGVIHLCKYCGKQIRKGSVDYCDCEEYKAKEKRNKLAEYQERINKAKEINFTDIDSDMWFYDEQSDKFFTEIESFVDFYFDKDKTTEELMNNVPNILWLCDFVDISIDADSIIEDACEELHEEARENISFDDIKELQDMLDTWCENQAGTKTAYPNYQKYVRVRKEWFE